MFRFWEGTLGLGGLLVLTGLWQLLTHTLMPDQISDP